MYGKGWGVGGGGGVAVVGGLQRAQVALQSLCPQAFAMIYPRITMMVLSMILYAAEQLQRSMWYRMSRICSGLINVPGTKGADCTVSCLT